MKISGEVLAGKAKFGHDEDAIKRFCQEIKSIHDDGVQICLVIGGGNVLRGRDNNDGAINRVTADYMGMLATVINGLAVKSVFESIGMSARVMSALDLTTIAEPFNRDKALRHMQKGRIVIFTAGIGCPYFSTDTASALRAIEMGCEVLLKATQVDGVYSSDPKKDATAKKYLTISYQEVLAKELQVMDISAISLAKDQNLPIVVFAMQKPGDLVAVLKGEGSFTIIK